MLRVLFSWSSCRFPRLQLDNTKTGSKKATIVRWEINIVSLGRVLCIVAYLCCLSGPAVARSIGRPVNSVETKAVQVYS